jgi:hypothetical protein
MSSDAVCIFTPKWGLVVNLILHYNLYSFKNISLGEQNVVGIVTRIRLNNLGVMARLPVEANNISICQSVKLGSEAYSVTYRYVNRIHQGLKLTIHPV